MTPYHEFDDQSENLGVTKMANSVAVQVFINDHHKKCVAALQQIAQLADTGSELHKQRFQPDGESDGIPVSWTVVEAIRQIANGVVSEYELAPANPDEPAWVTRFAKGKADCSPFAAQEIAAEVREMLVYTRAIQAMADQFIHPKTTAKELAEQILRTR